MEKNKHDKDFKVKKSKLLYATYSSFLILKEFKAILYIKRTMKAHFFVK